jgi:hypothetical protein
VPTNEELLRIMKAAKSKPDTLTVGKVEFAPAANPSLSPDFSSPKSTSSSQTDLMREVLRTNALLRQIKNILLGNSLSPNHKEEAGE